jgi:AcrR family transcriptional regulator
MEKRKYTLGRRAQQQHATRQRINDATMALHEEVGPRNTTISAIAERAGVQRLTVYRHFPDEAAVIHACSSTFTQLYPPPDVPQPQALQADAGVQDALLAMYAYYRRTHRMWRSVNRDAGEVEALREPLTQVAEHLAAYGQALVKRLRPRGEAGRELRAAVTLALSFATWTTLEAQGLGDKPMARMMAAWLESMSS